MVVASSPPQILANLKNQLRVILRSDGNDANEKTKAANGIQMIESRVIDVLLEKTKTERKESFLYSLWNDEDRPWREKVKHRLGKPLCVVPRSLYEVKNE